MAIIHYASRMESEDDTNGDLNLFIVHTDPFSQHSRFPFDGVNCNLWVNNLKQVYDYLQFEGANKKSNTLATLSTGRIVHGLMNPGTLALVTRAKKVVGFNLQ